jgi:hypothetical protein
MTRRASCVRARPTPEQLVPVLRHLDRWLDDPDGDDDEQLAHIAAAHVELERLRVHDPCQVMADLLNLLEAHR